MKVRVTWLKRVYYLNGIIIDDMLLKDLNSNPRPQNYPNIIIENTFILNFIMHHI